MHIERHVFGSYKGYTTLARSQGVTLDDCRIVERCAHSFGQTYESRYFKSLSKQPAYFTTQFGTTRRGLTRVIDGPVDDQGRPTLQFITVILSRADWDTKLIGDIESLAAERCLWEWDGSGNISAIDVSISGSAKIPSKVTPVALQVISQLERTFLTRKAVVSSESTLDFQIIRAIEILLPPASRGGITTAYRILSPQFPVRLISLASDAAGAATYRPEEGQPLSPYAQHIKLSGIDSGTIPVDRLASYRGFGEPPSRSGASSTSSSPTTLVTTVEKTEIKTRWSIAILAAVASLLLGITSGILLGKSRFINKSEIASSQPHTQPVLAQAQDIVDFEQILKKNGFEKYKDGWVKANDLDELKKKDSVRDEWMDNAKASMVYWQDKQWHTLDDAYALKKERDGFVKYKNQWITKEEADSYKKKEEKILKEPVTKGASTSNSEVGKGAATQPAAANPDSGITKPQGNQP